MKQYTMMRIMCFQLKVGDDDVILACFQNGKYILLPVQIRSDWQWLPQGQWWRVSSEGKFRLGSIRNQLISQVYHRYLCQVSVISEVDRAKERPCQWGKLRINMKLKKKSQTKNKIRFRETRLTDLPVLCSGEKLALNRQSSIDSNYLGSGTGGPKPGTPTLNRQIWAKCLFLKVESTDQRRWRPPFLQ